VEVNHSLRDFPVVLRSYKFSDSLNPRLFDLALGCFQLANHLGGTGTLIFFKRLYLCLNLLKFELDLPGTPLTRAKVVILVLTSRSEDHFERRLAQRLRCLISASHIRVFHSVVRHF